MIKRMIFVVSSLRSFPELMWNACMSVRAVWKNGKNSCLASKKAECNSWSSVTDFGAYCFQMCNFFFIDFSLCSSDWMRSTALSLSLQILSLLNLVCCWMPLWNFSVLFFGSVFSAWYFRTFSMSLLKFSLCLCIVLLTLVSIPWFWAPF